ncbi:hypothetical protein SERLA73DRAFT_190271 [Serpula lacrymans var. lacrymans S7.3]|uniref:PEBP-like protein n=2 Tax=Serpula lacrymans var. lacrymans TaxID=341189 RepID=F8QFD2_SERL3|nr:uncharacterized protein SERLADRAFT_479275 [Serpula lacrymans var. lacrymans S7.9]EGN92916.1 hypothetical protein SERLA73DRAFT_190271 [Serpula lacrymans var. lacrymans S7.3]EGO19638.1 hypothetical protein SERLADRAFT_479275 [Serpula lacrymans var. lacrymans S7.9]
MPLLDPLSSVTVALQSAKLTPSLVPPSFLPSALLSIVWPTGKEAVLGNELTVGDTTDEPAISFTPMVIPDSVDDASYTLAMVDPDAPSRDDPKYGQFRHWVVTGLKSPAATSSETTHLNALHTKPATTPYRPPGPRPGSGVHRYVFLLFQEPTSPPFSIAADAPEHGAALEERRSWNALDFAEKHNMKLTAVNFFHLSSSD